MGHDVARLAGVGHLGGHEVVEAAGDLVGHAVQQIDPLIQRQAAPLAAEGRRGPRTAASTSTLPASATGRSPSCRGRTLFEGLAAEAGGIFAADEILDETHALPRVKGEIAEPRGST